MTPPVRITISGEHRVVGIAVRQPSGVRRPDETGCQGRARQSRGASDTGEMSVSRRSGGLGRDVHPHGGGGALDESLRLPEENFPAVPLAPNCFFVSAPLRHYALDVGDTVGAGWDAQDQGRLQPRVTIAAMLCPAGRLRWLRDWVAGRPLAADSWGSGRAPVAADPARYQAGRDPEWFARGLATLEFLRHIQTLVRDNADLLTLIEAGEYDRAVRWIRAYDATLARLAG